MRLHGTAGFRCAIDIFWEGYVPTGSRLETLARHFYPTLGKAAAAIDDEHESLRVCDETEVRLFGANYYGGGRRAYWQNFVRAATKRGSLARARLGIAAASTHWGFWCQRLRAYMVMQAERDRRLLSEWFGVIVWDQSRAAWDETISIWNDDKVRFHVTVSAGEEPREVATEEADRVLAWTLATLGMLTRIERDKAAAKIRCPAYALAWLRRKAGHGGINPARVLAACAGDPFNTNVPFLCQLVRMCTDLNKDIAWWHNRIIDPIQRSMKWAGSPLACVLKRERPDLFSASVLAAEMCGQRGCKLCSPDGATKLRSFGFGSPGKEQLGTAAV